MEPRSRHHRGTTGPWVAIGRSVFQEETIGPHQIVFHARSHEDALLIAAAPEMLDALIVLVAHHGESGACKNCRYAESVIEKATRNPQEATSSDQPKS